MTRASTGLLAAASLALALALALALPAPGHGQAPAQAPPVFGVGVDLVRIDVIVLDRDGQPVTGLGKEDFTVEEDSRPQEVETFEPVVVKARPSPTEVEPPRLSVARVRAPGEGRAFFVYFDDTHVTPPAAERVRSALARFALTELREGDWFTVLAPGQNIWWTARSAWEYGQLAAVIGRIQGQYVRDPLRVGMSDWEAIQILDLGPSGLAQPTLAASGGGVPTGDATTPGPPGGGTASGGEGRMGVGARDPSFVAEEVASVARRRVDTTLSGLRRALDSLLPLRGHKSLVLVSEGFVLVPRMRGYAELVEVARRANVAMHFLDPRGLEPSTDAEGTAASGLGWATERGLAAAGADDVAAATGGRAIVTNDPTDGLRRIAAESEAYYLLGYQPSSAEAGERKVRVRVRGEGLTVRARTRYYAGEAEKAEARREKDEKRPKDETAGRTAEEKAAMRAVADTTGLPLRLSALFFEDNGKGQVTTMYPVEIRVPVEAPAKRKFRTVAEARPRDGGKAMRDEFETELDLRPDAATILSRHWHMPPGVWQIRVLVSDVATGKVGTALHTFEVPDPKAFRIASPILTTEMEKAEGRDRPRVVLARTFRAGRLLYVQYQVHGARDDPATRLPIVEAGWELRRGEEVVRSAAPTPIRPDWDGRLSRLLGLSLEGLSPGDYALALRVRDTAAGVSAETVEPFTVAP